jgi:peptide/nickel transport system ATP-binding protein
VSAVEAVAGVSLRVDRGATVGVVGESGAGKTTLAKAVLRLVPVTSGELLFNGEDILAMDRHALRSFRRRAQMVFQGAGNSLNPRMRAGPAIREALSVAGVARSELDGRVSELLDRVGLSGQVARAYPHELSGGQQQRVAIARALAVEPEFLVLDEPTSALDVSVQAQIVNLLLELQEEMALSYLLISHDLALVRRLSDHLVIMRRGVIVEQGDPDMVVRAPEHPYTRTLVAAAAPERPGGL